MVSTRVTHTQSASIRCTSWSQTGGTLAINANLAYGGSFTQSAGTMNITGVFLATAGTAAFTGKIAGTGLLKLAGGTDTFNAGASVSVAAWTVSGGSTLVTLAESLSYAGTFASGTDTLALGSGDKLILSNAASFAGTTVNGSGILYLSLWAGFSLFHLIPAGVAFAAMIWSLTYPVIFFGAIFVFLLN